MSTASSLCEELILYYFSSYYSACSYDIKVASVSAVVIYCMGSVGYIIFYQFLFDIGKKNLAGVVLN